MGKGPVVRGSEASVGTGQCAGREGRDQDIQGLEGQGQKLHFLRALESQVHIPVHARVCRQVGGGSGNQDLMCIWKGPRSSS